MVTCVHHDRTRHQLGSLLRGQLMWPACHQDDSVRMANGFCRLAMQREVGKVSNLVELGEGVVRGDARPCGVQRVDESQRGGSAQRAGPSLVSQPKDRDRHIVEDWLDGSYPAQYVMHTTLIHQVHRVKELRGYITRHAKLLQCAYLAAQCSARVANPGGKEGTCTYAAIELHDGGHF